MSDTTLASKLAQAIADLGGRLKADKRNLEARYDYISADKVLSEAGQALAGQGIAIFTSITEEATDAITYTNSRGENKQRFDCRVGLLMTVTDGTSEAVHSWMGRGSDYTVPDKAMYKAITSGHKYFLMKLLSIGEGNEDGEHQEEPPSTPKQAAKAPAPVHRAPPAAEPEPEVDFRAEEPVTRITDKQRKQFMMMGISLYGADAWDDKRPELIKWVTKGRAIHTNDMTTEEASKLIDKVAEKVRERDAERAVAA